MSNGENVIEDMKKVADSIELEGIDYIPIHLEQSVKAERVKKLILSTERSGVTSLIKFMESRRYFTCPGSYKRHCSYEGGLLDHSINIYNILTRLNKMMDIGLDKETIIFAAFLHDLCKANLYSGEQGNYVYNYFVGNKGHAKYSIERAERFIELKPLEKEMIKFHMGMYSSKEFWEKGEYTFKELKVAFDDIRVKMFYFCDDMAASLLDTNTEGGEKK